MAMNGPKMPGLAGRSLIPHSVWGILTPQSYILLPSSWPVYDSLWCKSGVTCSGPRKPTGAWSPNFVCLVLGPTGSAEGLLLALS